MSNTDIIFIAQSEAVNYEEYSKLPLDRIELYSDLIFPRMVYYRKAFRSNLDIINYFSSGIFFQNADYPKRRELLNIWNLPAMNSIHIPQYLARYGITSKVINNFDSGWDLFCDAYEKSAIPPLVCVSTTFYLSYAEVKRITKKVRRKYPGAKIVLGGAFINEQMLNAGADAFEKPMRSYGINYLLHALNSETDLKDLVLSVRKGSGLAKVNNLIYMEGGDPEKGTFKVTAVKWNGPVLEKTFKLPGDFDASFIKHTVQMRTSYGCPFSCEFCSYPATAKEFAMMPCEDAGRYISGVLDIKGVDRIIFIDDTFNAFPKRFKDMCALFYDHRFDWFAFLRVQSLDEEACKLMRDSRCKCVYLGIESANDGVLENMNKKATRAQFSRGLGLLKKYGIKSVAAFIIGFPGETDATIRDDIDFIEETAPDFYTLKEFYYMKHAPVYNKRDRYALSGIGADWTHSTMDYKTAHKRKIGMFRDIKNSIFVDPDMNMWYIAYLYDQGYGMDEIRAIQMELNAVMRSQIGGKYGDNHPSFDRLRELLSGRTVKQC